jgi:hypothetical protein
MSIISRAPIVVLALTVTFGAIDFCDDGAIAAPPRPRPTRKPMPAAPEVAPEPSQEQLELAKRKGAAQALAGQGLEAFGERRFGHAAEMFDKAYLQFKDENLLWNAGQAWERAGELKLAKDRYTDFLGYENVPASLRIEAGDALVRVGRKLAAREAASTPRARLDLLQRELVEAKEAGNTELSNKLEGAIVVEQRKVQAEDDARPTDTAEWVLIGSGSAVAITGLVLTLVGQSELDSVSGAQSGDAPTVTATTRREAAAAIDNGETMRLVGIITGAAGLAIATTGLILLVMGDDAPPQTGGRIDVGAALTPSGGSVNLHLRF